MRTNDFVVMKASSGSSSTGTSGCTSCTRVFATSVAGIDAQYTTETTRSHDQYRVPVRAAHNAAARAGACRTSPNA